MPQPVSSLLQWYRSTVRRFLENADPQRVESSDAESARLGALEQTFSEDVPICFLGKAGVGKSTLINALVSEHLLPHGGVGPLTAQALSVRFGEHASFEVHYHKPGRVGRVAFALQQTHLAELRRQGRAVEEDRADELLALLDDDAEPTASLKAATKEVVQPDEEQEKRNRELRKDALIMVGGRQDVERETPYLADRLRESVGQPARFGTVCLPEDAERLEHLRAALNRGSMQQPFVCLEADANFRAALRDHASGFLAPTIKSLEVRWNAPLLRSGIVLIDLPGIGIAGDVLAKVTEGFIREQAQVVVLVSSVRGLDITDADLLRQSGFLSRLLHAADDPEADPVQLVMAVVRADEVALADYEKDSSREPKDYLAAACADARRARSVDLREKLTEIWRAGDELSETKQEVLDRLLAGLEVHAVSAKQFQSLAAKSRFQPAFIDDPEESYIPNLSRSLEALAERLNARRRDRLERARSLFFSGLTTRLRLLREQWQQETRAEDEANKLRAELETYLKPKHEEFIASRAQYRAFLRETIPAEIEKLVLEASILARKSIDRYLGTLSDAHWRTLRATVERGGTFAGSTREIALPRELAQRFEDPIAEIWGKKLLQLIRKRTSTYAEDCVTLVEEVLDWAKQQGARVKTALLEAQRDQIKSDAQQLTAVGKDLIDELRAEVKNRLMETIRGPIRERCEKFVTRNQHLGTGTRQRILGLFQKLAEEVVDAAAEPAKELFTGRFKTVEKEIGKVLRADENPVTSAAEAIVESHEATVRRSDAQRRKGILRQIDEVEAASPMAWPSTGAVDDEATAIETA